MGQGEPQYWRTGLQRADPDVGGSKVDSEAWLGLLDLEWWYVDGTGHDILGQPTRLVFVELWKGKNTPRPEAPPWFGWSDRSLDEALGKALWRYFAGRETGQAKSPREADRNRPTRPAHAPALVP